MNWKFTGVLVLLLAGLGGYAYFVEYSGQLEEKAKEAETKRLFTDVDFDNLDYYELFDGEERIVIQRVPNPDYTPPPEGEKPVDAEGQPLLDSGPGQVWMITSPIETRANESIVNSIKNALATGEIKQVISEDPQIDLAPFGLNPPKSKLVFGVGAQKKTLLVGGKAPVGGALYLKIEGDARVLQIASSSLEYNTAKKLDDLREKRLFPNLAISDVESFEIANSRGRFVFARDPATATMWNVVSPVSRRADKGPLEAILRQAVTLRAEAFIDEKPSDYQPFGFEGEGAASVKMKLSQNRGTLEILQGSKTENDRYFVRRSDRSSVVSVANTLAEKLEFELPDLFSKQMTEIPAADIHAYRIERDGASYSIVRGEGDSLNFNGKPDAIIKDVEKRKIENKINAMRAETVLPYREEDLAPFGLLNPRLTLTLTDINDATLEIIKIGSRAPGEDAQYYASNMRQDSLYTIPESFLESFPAPTEAEEILVDKPKAPEQGEAPVPERDADGLAIPSRTP